MELKPSRTKETAIIPWLRVSVAREQRFTIFHVLSSILDQLLGQTNRLTHSASRLSTPCARNNAFTLKPSRKTFVHVRKNWIRSDKVSPIRALFSLSIAATPAARAELANLMRTIWMKLYRTWRGYALRCNVLGKRTISVCHLPVLSHSAGININKSLDRSPVTSRLSRFYPVIVVYVLFLRGSLENNRKRDFQANTVRWWFAI